MDFKEYLDAFSKELDLRGVRAGSKITVGLSGGVDSTVTALILKELKFDVSAVFIHCWKNKSHSKIISELLYQSSETCTADQDETDAVRSATQIGIPIEVIDLTKEYDKYVMNYFWEEYQTGRVPNADILCNTYIKFGVFADYAFKNGADYIATGHYARIINTKNLRSKKGNLLSPNLKSRTFSARVELDNIAISDKKPRVSARGLSLIPNNDNQDNMQQIGRTLLATPFDKSKDQSYFLYQVNEKTLRKTLFPIGGLLKTDVRKFAKQFKLHNSQKEDSQGICFVGNVNIRNFISQKIQRKKGDVVNVSGEIIGEHIGCNFYTIGQRHGFSIFSYSPEPLYVIDKICDKNIIVVGSRDLAYSDEFIVDSKTSILSNKEELNVGVRIRNLGRINEAYLYNGFKLHTDVDVKHPNNDDNGLNRDSVLVKTKNKLFGITPGQHAVFYQHVNEHSIKDLSHSTEVDMSNLLNQFNRVDQLNRSNQSVYVVLGGGVIKYVNTMYKKRFSP